MYCFIHNKYITLPREFIVTKNMGKGPVGKVTEGKNLKQLKNFQLKQQGM